MSEKTEVVPQTDDSSASTEIKPEIKTSNPNDDYKRDMFKYKQEARELKERLEAIELEKQQKKGNFTEVIAKLKEEVSTHKREKQELKGNFAEARLNEAIKSEAMKKGVKGQSLDVFMKLVDDNSKSIVEFDESYNVKTEDISNVVDETLTRYGDVFAKKVNIADGTPNSTPTNYEKKIDISKLSGDELFAYIRKNQHKLK